MRRLLIMVTLVSGTALVAPRAGAQLHTGLGAPLPEGAFSRLETGPLSAAFAGSPLKLSPLAERVLRGRFPNDAIPVIPEPFRRQLDAALVARDWPRVLSRRSDLGASRGKLAMLMWEETRFLATGSLWLAELESRDLATAGFPGTQNAAVTLWFYAVAVTMTDGHKCIDENARDTHLESLRSGTFGPVLAAVRAMPDAQLAAQRDVALKLEAGLAPERNEDTVCRNGGGTPAVRPPEEWRAAAQRTREILVKHLNAFCALVRAKPMNGATAASSATGKR